MKYKIKIEGMQCLSCGTLIGLLFADQGLQYFKLNQSDATATFESNEDDTAVKQLVDRAFAETTKYSYSSLVKLAE